MLDTKLKVLILSLPILFDLNNIDMFRNLLFQMLIGNTNRRHARRIRKEQLPKDRLTMGYIEKHLKRFQREYKIYHRGYIIYLWSVIPLYCIAMAFLFASDKAFIIAISIIAFLKLSVFIAVRIPFGSDGHVSRYAYTPNDIAKKKF